jgi:FkbM family methyltransferase
MFVNSRFSLSLYEYVLNEHTIQRQSIHKLYVDCFKQLALHINAKISMECGANEAGYSKYIASALPSCKIYAFEANPIVFNHYVQQEAFPANMEYINKAVSDKNGFVTFFAPSLKETGLLSTTAGIGSILRQESKSFPDWDEQDVTVESITIDSFLNSFPQFYNVAMWIDVEGANKELLSGAQISISSGKIAIINIEVESKPKWKNQWTDIDVIEFFSNNNYIPLLRDNQFRYQYNICFINKSYFDAKVYYIASNYLHSIFLTQRISDLRYKFQELYNFLIFKLGKTFEYGDYTFHIDYIYPNTLIKIFIKGIAKDIHYELYAADNYILYIGLHFEFKDRERKKITIDMAAMKMQLLDNKFNKLFKKNYKFERDAHGIAIQIPFSILLTPLFAKLLLWIINNTLEMAALFSMPPPTRNHRRREMTDCEIYECCPAAA